MSNRLANGKEYLELSEVLVFATQNLARIRQVNNVTQKQISEKLGITNGTFSRWEKNNFSNIKLSDLVAYLDYLESLGIDTIRTYRDILKNKQ